MNAPNPFFALTMRLDKKPHPQEPDPTCTAASAFQFLSTLASDDPVQPLPDQANNTSDFNPFFENEIEFSDDMSSPEIENHIHFEDPVLSSDSYDDDDLYIPRDSTMYSVDEAFSMKWDQERIAKLLVDGGDPVKSPLELMDEVRPVMSKQELPNAHHSMALLMTQKLPLLSIEHNLFYRCGTAYDSIDSADLYDLLCDITDKSIHGGIKRSGRKELYSSVASVRNIQVSIDDISRNPNLIPLLDKVYDIETGRCHDPRSDEIFFSRINLSSEEIGVGDNRLFERFLETSFGNDSHVIERFLQVQGVILSPYTPKAIFHYFGPHNTGKSEAVRLISQFLRPQAKYIHSIDDPNKLTERFALAPLQGKRVLLCPDASKIAFKESTCAVLKQLAGGGDRIGSDNKHSSYVTFVNEAKPLFISNHPLRGDFDEAFLSRLVTIPFHETITPEKRIPNLAEKIFESRGCVFLAAMQGLRNLIDHNFVFAPIDAPPSYQLAETETGGVATIDGSVFSFGKECCVFEDSAFSSSQSLFEAYQRYCTEYQLAPIRDKAVFGRTLHAAFPAIQNRRTSSYNGYTGIRLL